jgi:hypothetical protein
MGKENAVVLYLDTMSPSHWYFGNSIIPMTIGRGMTSLSPKKKIADS